MLFPRLGALPALPTLLSKHKPCCSAAERAQMCQGAQLCLFVHSPFPRHNPEYFGIGFPFTALSDSAGELQSMEPMKCGLELNTLSLSLL